MAFRYTKSVSSALYSDIHNYIHTYITYIANIPSDKTRACYWQKQTQTDVKFHVAVQEQERNRVL